MNRREFVTVLGTAAAWWLTRPPLIGAQASGCVCPFPDNIHDYVTWHSPTPMVNQLRTVHRLTAQVAWWPLGSSVGMIQMYAGMFTENPSLSVQQQRSGLLESLRSTWKEDHRPGELRVLGTGDTVVGEDEDGPIYERTRIWTPVSYVRWMKPSEIDGRHPRRIEAA